MYMSKVQLETLNTIFGIEKRFGKGRYFTQGELPHVTMHTLNALVNKGFLEEFHAYTGVVYYKKTDKKIGND